MKLHGAHPMRVWVVIKPGARMNQVEKLSDGSLRISVTARAAAGEANEALRHLLADHFNIPVSRIVIIRGKKSRRKLLSI